MKQLFCTLSAFCLGALLLAGCSGGSSGSATVSSVSAPLLSSSASVPAPSTAVSSGAAASSLPAGGGLDATLTALSEAAGLGSTIKVSEIDLKANGLDTANVVAFAGAESQLSSENGGIVLVFQMQPGATADMVSALGAYRDARAGDDRYAEFATARENTKGARIVEKGDLVIYAVSATGQEGGYDGLDAAIAALG